MSTPEALHFAERRRGLIGGLCALAVLLSTLAVGEGLLRIETKEVHPAPCGAMVTCRPARLWRRDLSIVFQNRECTFHPTSHYRAPENTWTTSHGFRFSGAFMVMGSLGAGSLGCLGLARLVAMRPRRRVLLFDGLGMVLDGRRLPAVEVEPRADQVILRAGWRRWVLEPDDVGTLVDLSERLDAQR